MAAAEDLVRGETPSKRCSADLQHKLLLQSSGVKLRSHTGRRSLLFPQHAHEPRLCGDESLLPDLQP